MRHIWQKRGLLDCPIHRKVLHTLDVRLKSSGRADSRCHPRSVQDEDRASVFLDDPEGDKRTGAPFLDRLMMRNQFYSSKKSNKSTLYKTCRIGNGRRPDVRTQVHLYPTCMPHYTVASIELEESACKMHLIGSNRWCSRREELEDCERIVDEHTSLCSAADTPIRS